MKAPSSGSAAPVVEPRGAINNRRLYPRANERLSYPNITGRDRTSITPQSLIAMPCERMRKIVTQRHAVDARRDELLDRDDAMPAPGQTGPPAYPSLAKTTPMGFPIGRSSAWAAPGSRAL